MNNLGVPSRMALTSVIVGGAAVAGVLVASIVTDPHAPPLVAGGFSLMFSGCLFVLGKALLQIWGLSD